jgi:hypothetical protein
MATCLSTSLRRKDTLNGDREFLERKYENIGTNNATQSVGEKVGSSGCWHC